MVSWLGKKITSALNLNSWTKNCKLLQNKEKKEDKPRDYLLVKVALIQVLEC